MIGRTTVHRTQRWIGAGKKRRKSRTAAASLVWRHGLIMMLQTKIGHVGEDLDASNERSDTRHDAKDFVC